MIRIQKLSRPNKKSGHNLMPGATTKIRGMQITNISAGKQIFVDKFTVPPKKRKKKK